MIRNGLTTPRKPALFRGGALKLDPFMCGVIFLSHGICCCVAHRYRVLQPFGLGLGKARSGIGIGCVFGGFGLCTWVMVVRMGVRRLVEGISVK